ncbi:hypothetical protein [Seleniivibrio sp.]|uniref:hypothetical protein n=1 Tax=Seleniivibrio sp. TaxID=2898801 RepID=UPI0025E6771E|nr:hypothetical protein [Seleniivibrio sp.]MCD8553024.1 hypothetical protein [Seleniivibrio sp.]
MNNYLIYYKSEEQMKEWLKTLMQIVESQRVGLVSSFFPIIGNLSVIENILLPLTYHHKITYSEALDIVGKDLENFGLKDIMHFRNNQLNDYQKMIVKYLQVKYLRAEWIVFFSPRRMYIAEYEEKFHQFLRCEDLKKSVIIDHENHRHLFDDMQDYTEKDFDTWVTRDLKTSNSK